jgi:lysophospholipase L1-like esterase
MHHQPRGRLTDRFSLSVTRRIRAGGTLSLLFGMALVACGCSTATDVGAGPESGSGGALNAQSGAPSVAGTAGDSAVGGGRGGVANNPGASGGVSGTPGGSAGSSTFGVSGGGTGGDVGEPVAGAAGTVGIAGAGSGGASGGAPSIPSHMGAWRITPLGDSITGTTCGPQLLSKALIDHGKTNFKFVGSNLNNQSCNGAANVQTEGHGGYLITDLVGSGMHASELPKWCDSNKSDLVLMQFGTNDVWNDRSPSAILAAYSTVLDDLRAANPNVILLVAQITPLNPSNCSACESRVAALNSQIPAWAASKSTAASPVLVVDLHSAFNAASYTQNSMYTSDGVHPNVAGGQLIADKWYAALVALGVP